MEQNALHSAVMRYQGPFFMDLLAATANWIRGSMPFSLRVKLKVHKIFVELAQNVSHYSAERIDQGSEVYGTCGIGCFHIFADNEFVFIQTSNLILKEHGSILAGYCQQINSMELEQLKAFKAANRNHREMKTSAAHIGLIHVGIISEQPLDFLIEEKDERFSIFTVTAKVKNMVEI